MLSAYLAIHAALLFGASDSKPITEARLVGTWTPSAKTMFFIHGSPTITYHADHTCAHTSYGEDGASIAQGTWRLQGRELVTRFGEVFVVREVVLSVKSDQFRTRTRDGTVFTYTRVKPER